VSWSNYDDVLEQLRGFGLLDRHGGMLLDLEVDTTRPVRGLVEGEDRELRGWYWLNEIQIDGERYIVGAYGCYHGNDPGKRKVELRRDGKRREITPEQKEAIKARQRANQARMKAMREAEAERAAQHAAMVWRAYVEEGASDYLQRKGVRAYGVRFSPSGNGTFAVPMMDAGGKVWGVQIVRGKGRGSKLEKQYFPKGVAVQGHYHLLGGIPAHLVLVAEGYATAASLHEATGLPVAVAFDAGNLLHVATAIKKAYRRARILVCADDDYLSAGNPGVTAAQAAAHAVDGAWVAPVFAVERPIDKKGPTDFNDLQALEGQAVVRAQVEARLRELGWPIEPSGRETVAKGAGERTALPSIMQVDDALDRYVLVYGGKGTLFDDVEHMLVPKVDVVELLPKDGWNEMRARKRVARLDEVGFDPAGADPRIRCNLWGGWPTTPRAGRCEALLELLEYLCSGEANAAEIYKWVLRWLAYPIQHPGAKMRTALVFHGPQGTGKNLFFEAVMAIYGDYGRIIDQSAIEDKFNDWASRKLFLIADEVVARQELFHTKNKLKGIITGEWIRINPKNVAAHDERNHVNLVFLSNESQPLVLEHDDRRYTVIRTPEQLSAHFYADVKAELADGGVAALHDHLLNLDLGDFDEHAKPPMTEAKIALIDRSMDSVLRFLRDWQAGDIEHRPGDPPLPFCPCSSSHLYRAYLEWCRRMGEPRPRPENQFAGDIGQQPGWSKDHKNRRKSFNSSETIRQRFVIPSDKALAGSIHAREPAENLTEWLTRGFFAFNEAMGGPE
jgi:putative DNA primase/helicase